MQQQASRKIAQRVLDKYGAQLEAEYQASRREAAENLYNSIASILGEQHPTIETILYVLEMIKFDLLQQKNVEHFSPAAASRVAVHDNVISMQAI